MADAPPVVHIGENSPEQVAYRLMKDILGYDKAPSSDANVVRKHILDLYAECLVAVRGERSALEGGLPGLVARVKGAQATK